MYGDYRAPRKRTARQITVNGMHASKDTTVLETILGYDFLDSKLLFLALTHRSIPLQEDEDHNEKLEFLGDSVLDLAISELLFHAFPAYREGDLSKLRASLVNAETLAEKARVLSLGGWVRMGAGEEQSGGRQKQSILAATYEAILGAVFLDGGYKPAKRLVAKHFESELQTTGRISQFDNKTRLQEITQKTFKEVPLYEIVGMAGPDHEKSFVSQVSISGKVYGRGEGPSKKRAHQAAASNTLVLLRRQRPQIFKTE